MKKPNAKTTGLKKTLRTKGVFMRRRRLLVLMLCVWCSGCSILSTPTSRNEVRVRTYALDERGNLSPVEETAIVGIWSDGAVRYDQTRVYQNADGASVKLFDNLSVVRLDDATTAGQVAAVRAQATEDVAATTTKAAAAGAVAYLTAGSSAGLEAIPAILQAIKGVISDAEDAKEPKKSEDGKEPKDTEKPEGSGQ